MTDDVTDNIVVRGCPGSIIGSVLKKKKKKAYIYYMYCISYMSYILYISYMHIIYIYIYIFIYLFLSILVRFPCVLHTVTKLITANVYKYSEILC